ncbi:MAG: hypothetical protein JJE52_04105 [Acidimicrobiia bacterium]|nr:hypothetical protein [Acidimicrobiia bacterium]
MTELLAWSALIILVVGAWLMAGRFSGGGATGRTPRDDIPGGGGAI